MSIRPSWATEDFDAAFEIVNALDMLGGEPAKFEKLLLTAPLAGKIYTKTIALLTENTAADDHRSISSILVHYHVALINLYLELNRVDKFTAPRERKIAQNKVIGACDDILANIGKVGIEEVVYKASSKDLYDDRFVKGDMRMDLFIDVVSIIKDIRNSALSISPSYIQKVKVRDAKFIYFCRGLKALNEEHLGTPYLESIVFFAYGLLTESPQSDDKMTMVRNACNNQGMRVTK